MRRGLIVALLATFMALPASVSAAAPPTPTLEIPDIAWAERGVIAVDVAWSCVAAPSGAEWFPYLDLYLEAGRRGHTWGVAGIDLKQACDGKRHEQTVRVRPDGRLFHGTRFALYAFLDASWYVEKTDRYVDQSLALDPMPFRLTRH